MAKNLIHGMSNKASRVLVEVVDMDGQVTVSLYAYPV